MWQVLHRYDHSRQPIQVPLKWPTLFDGYIIQVCSKYEKGLKINGFPLSPFGRKGLKLRLVL